MKGKKILVTGGAGFVGSHLVDLLIEKGHDVIIYDNLEPQVHGPERKKPDYLNPEAQFVLGDVRDRELLTKTLEGVEVIFHQAARVGVGQSMYEIEKYTSYNSLGGAILLDIIINNHKIRDKVEKIVVASSMSIYGEGKYKCDNCGIIYPKLRPTEQLKKHIWEVLCPHCGRELKPLPTDEDKPLFPTSIYAITKRDHEEMFLAIGRSYKIPTVALRYFNIYGPRQALSNPYTGVAAIFSSRLLNKKPPVIFENGLQTRDFIHVKDIAIANYLAMEKEEANYEVFNVGTGRNLTIKEVAEILKEKICPELDIKPVIENKYREGDIRHCYADISKISNKLGFKPSISFEDGIEDLTNWVRTQKAEDRFEQARLELKKYGLAE